MTSKDESQAAKVDALRVRVAQPNDRREKMDYG